MVCFTYNPDNPYSAVIIFDTEALEKEKFLAMHNWGVEYYIKVEAANGEKLVWPPTASHINQIVILN